MKGIKIYTPKGEYVIPMDKVAKRRANYGIEGDYDLHMNSGDWECDFKITLANPEEQIVWIMQNTTFESWKNDIHRINSKFFDVGSEFWLNNNNFEVINFKLK